MFYFLNASSINLIQRFNFATGVTKLKSCEELANEGD